MTKDIRQYEKPIIILVMIRITIRMQDPDYEVTRSRGGGLQSLTDCLVYSSTCFIHLFFS